jgi:pimeloyl-ACP methyl ester carboxylesterase
MTMTQRFLGALMALAIAASTSAQSLESPTAAVTVVLVHGALIDGSSWRGVYDVLTRDGYRVSVVQPPLTGLAQRRAVESGPLNDYSGGERHERRFHGSTA